MPPAPAATLPRGRPVIAWVVILLLVSLAVAAQAVRPRLRGGDRETRLDIELMRGEGRQVVGMTLLPGASREEVYRQAQALNTGPLDRRLRFIVLAGELAGPSEALEQLRLLRARMVEHDLAPTEEQQAVLDDLRLLYTDYAADRLHAPSVYEPERDRLRRDLGWFGELALAPPGTPDEAAREAALRPAKRTAWTLLAGLALVLLSGMVGFAGLMTLLVLLLLGRLRGGLVCGQTAGSVYAETFAVWLALFGVLGLLSELVPLPGSKLLLGGVAALLSLAALFWPVWRGIPWQQVRQDIGWVHGRRGWLEPAYGVVCYVAWLPVVLLAMLLVVGLYLAQNRHGGNPVDNFAPTRSPAHPVALDIGKGGWWGIVQVFVVAAVVAPIVEETMFRGVLYRHLREATGCWRPVCSMLLSGGITSFLFAVIHPQGLIAVPLLMALAGGFTIAREWRGTLAPAMVAHGLNNAAAMVFSLLVLGG